MLLKDEWVDVGYLADPGKLTPRISLRVHLLYSGDRKSRHWGGYNGGIRVEPILHRKSDESVQKPSKGGDGSTLAAGDPVYTRWGRRGTVGAILGTQEKPMALSAGHNWKPIGAKVLHGGAGGDCIGKVVRSNPGLDAAVAHILPQGKRREIRFDILQVPGGIHGSVDPRLGMRVVKTGATSRKKYGYIEGVGATDFSIGLLPGQKGALTRDGDSGSMWIEVESGAAVGLHTAGETESTEPECAWASWISLVEDEFEIEIARRTAWNGKASAGPAIAVWKESLVLAMPTRRRGKLKAQLHNGKSLRSGSRLESHGVGSKTEKAATLVAFGTKLVLVWVDRKTHEIRCATSKNGGKKWTSPRGLRVQSLSTPALAVLGRRLVLAWREAGTNRVCIASTTDLEHWSPRRALRGKTKSGPALATLKSRLLVAWTDARSSKIAVVSGTEAGIERARPIRTSFATKMRPALQVHAGCIYLAWTAAKGRRQHLASSHDGRRWSDPPLAMHDTAIDGPALASQGHDLLWAWTDAEGKITSLRTERRHDGRVG